MHFFSVILHYIGHGQRNTGDWCFQDGFITFKELAALYLQLLRGHVLTIVSDCSYSGCWVKECMTFLDEQGVGPCGHAAKDKGMLINVYASCLSHQIPRKLAFSVVGCKTDKESGFIISNLYSSVTLDVKNRIADSQYAKGMNFTNIMCGQESIDEECLCLPGATWKKCILEKEKGHITGTTDGDGVSCSQLDPEVREDIQFILENMKRQITERYARFVYHLCASVKATGVSVEDFRTFLLKLPAFANDQQGKKLLSGATAEMKAANTINEIFDLIDGKYASFLNYDIFRSIQHTFCRGLDSEDLNYSEHLKAYVNDHKISEFCLVNSQLAKFNDTDEKLRFKFDFEMVSSKVAKVLDTKKRIAHILGVTPSVLQLLSVEEGCLIVTFLTTAFVADAILSADGELTTKQMEDFCAISILWVECGGHRVEISSGKDSLVCVSLVQHHSNLSYKIHFMKYHC